MYLAISSDARRVTERLRSLLLCLCDVFQGLIHFLCVLILHERPSLVLFQAVGQNNHARPPNNMHCVGPTRTRSALRRCPEKVPREGAPRRQLDKAQATQNSLLKNVTRLRDRHFLFARGAHLVVDQAVVSDLPLGLLWWPPVDGDGSGGQGVGAQVDGRTGDVNCNTERQQLLTYSLTQNKHKKALFLLHKIRLGILLLPAKAKVVTPSTAWKCGKRKNNLP